MNFNPVTNGTKKRPQFVNKPIVNLSMTYLYSDQIVQGTVRLRSSSGGVLRLYAELYVHSDHESLWHPELHYRRMKCAIKGIQFITMDKAKTSRGGGKVSVL